MKSIRKKINAILMMAFLIPIFSIMNDSAFIADNEVFLLKNNIVCNLGNEKGKLSTSSCANWENLEAILNQKLSDFNSLGYFPQSYEPSLQATYHALYILQTLGKLDLVNTNEIIAYITGQYDEDLGYFMDNTALRYLDTDFSLIYCPLTTLLEVNCYAILTLEILGRLDLIDVPSFIDFIWSCYHPETSGFIGRPYNENLEPDFKISTMDNTYYAIKTLDLLMANWNTHIGHKDKLIEFILSLQDIEGGYNDGGFSNDLGSNYSTTARLIPDQNLYACYYCLKSLGTFNMLGAANIPTFHLYLDRLFFTNYFKISHWTNITNIVATAIGLELVGLTDHNSINEGGVLEFILEHRNSLGSWDGSTSDKVHELIDTFQIIRSLEDSGHLSQLSPQDQSEIANAVLLYHQFQGFSFISEDYVSIELMNSIINAFRLTGRISDLNIPEVYDFLKKFVRFNSYYYFYACIDKNGFYYPMRAYPIEYNCIGRGNYTEEINFFFYGHRATYLGLDAILKLFKLSEFDDDYDLLDILDKTIKSQFLTPIPEKNGGFLPAYALRSASIDFQAKLVNLESSFYAIKAMELIVDFLELGDISELPFNKTALYKYIKSYIKETSTTLYFSSGRENTIETLIKNTYQAASILKAIGLYDLNTQKLKTFLCQSLNYTNLENIYYEYRLAELLDIDLNFNYSKTISLIEQLYSSEFNEFFLSLEFNEINPANFFWVVDMAMSSELEIECDYRDPLILGGVNSLSTSFINLVLDEFGEGVTVLFESPQLGTLSLEHQGCNIYQKSFLVPESSLCFPKIEGLVTVYNSLKILGQATIGFHTYFIFHTSGIDVKEDQGIYRYQVNISYEFSSGKHPTSNTIIQLEIHSEDMFSDSLQFEREDYIDYSIFTGGFSAESDEKYDVEIYLIDEYHPAGSLLYESTINPNAGNTIVPLYPIKSILSIVITGLIWGFAGFCCFWVIKKVRRRSRRNIPLKLELEIKGDKKAQGILEDILRGEKE